MKKIVIYQTADNKTKVEVTFEEESFWLSLNQISDLFKRDKSVISRHLRNIFKENELDKKSVVAKNATTAKDGKTYQVDYYNLDVILSIGYRVNSKQGTQFRQWATQQLKEYLIQGYSINQKRLAEKEMEIQYLKSGIHIMRRTVEQQANSLDDAKGLALLLDNFSDGLTLLDDYDHERLDKKGHSSVNAVFIGYEDFIKLIHTMRDDFSSPLFGQEKDDSFKSSIAQIYQSFGGEDLYASLEEKASMLLYLVVKNHSFVDGNKRIAAACFLYFMEKNKLLYNAEKKSILSGNTLASLTLLIAESKAEEMETIKQVVISILNRKNAGI